MWSNLFTKPVKPTRSLDEAMLEVVQEGEWLSRADETLAKARKKYPVLADTLDSPQSPDKHAEGPRVNDHIRLMLASLNAIVAGKLNLLEIEEFARLKGYEGEIEEIQNTIKEWAAFFEVFVLMHDIAKGPSVRFIPAPDSLGAELGFGTLKAGWDDIGGEERLVWRKTYDDLYAQFASTRVGEKRQMIQVEFFKKYQISVSNWGHAKAIYKPHLEESVRRCAKEYRLNEKDTDLLVDIIAMHLEPLIRFRQAAEPKEYDYLVVHANRQGYDADDYLDLLGGCVMLDMVLGRQAVGAHGYWHDPHTIENFLRAEHDWAPWKKAEGMAMKEQQTEQTKKQVLKEVGLDGESLMDLTGMTPGPELGKLLRNISQSLDSIEHLPEVGVKYETEILRRIGEARIKINEL